MSLVAKILDPFNDFSRSQNKYFSNPIDRLAETIKNIIMLPFKLLTFFFIIPLLPILIPIAILHDIFVIYINVIMFFTILTIGTIGISSLFVLTAAEIILPIKIITIALTTYIAYKFIDNIYNEK